MTAVQEFRKTAKKYGFIVLQPDVRLTAAAAELCDAGYTQLQPEQAEQAAFILLGVPTKDLQPHLSVLRCVKAGTVLFAGAVSQAARLAAADLSLPVIDYMDSEELALFNAIPTAEGALGILLGATPDTLCGARVLLLGYGRVAQALLPRLQGLGAQVTVAVRSRAAAARAQLLCAKTALLTGRSDDPVLLQQVNQADIVVNTAPQLLVTKQVLSAMRGSVFVLDLASAPGGVDLAAAKNLGIAAIHAPGLPGKWAPAAAGRAVGQTVLRFLRAHPLQPRCDVDRSPALPRKENAP